MHCSVIPGQGGDVLTIERGGSSDTRLSRTSCSISSALRKREKGSSLQAQWTASMQEEIISGSSNS